MADTVDVAALAKLARLEVTDAELQKLEKEIPDILHFVETIQKAHTQGEEKSPKHRNITRVDENPFESATFTKKILADAPEQRDEQIVVKQVISRKK